MHIRKTSATSRARAGRWSLAGTAIAAAVLAACGGGGGSGGGVGAVRVALTDAPACGFDNVYVTVEKVLVHQSSTAAETDAGWSEIPLKPARRIDLLTLTNGALQELGATPLPSGRYTQMRLVLASSANGENAMPNSVVPTGGQEVALTIPSGAQSGIKVQSDFDVAAGKTADIVLDFDACKSVAQAGNSGAYQLKPVISVLPRVDSGIKGTVASALASGSTTVSAQKDGVTVRSTTPDSRGNFSIPFLRPGTYDLVITSEGHATGVITGVPVDSAATTVATSASPIALPQSAMAEITGALAANPEETPAEASAFTEAHVRAWQPLTGMGPVEVSIRAVNGVDGTYSLKVPKAAPMKAAYTSSGPLSFTPDASNAGQYHVDVLVAGDAS